MHPGPEAWHEAGHALIAHALGGSVREVTLESERDGHDGHTAVEWLRVTTDEEARRQATVALAGPVAELTLHDEEIVDNPNVLSSWRGDWDVAEAELTRLHPDAAEREAALRAILRELYAFFEDERNREALARVADALDAHQTLDEALFADALEVA